MNNPLPHRLPHSREISTIKRLGSGHGIMRLLAGFAFILLLTCAADARPPVWEYRVVNAHFDNRQLESLLNSNGAEGWELVQISAKGVAVFKRQKTK